MLLPRSPLSFYFRPRRSFHKNHVRLACVKHAASVRPEPGSNSLLKVRLLSLTFCYTKLLFFFVLSKFLSLYEIVNVSQQPLHYTTSFFGCQHFFKIFLLKIFNKSDPVFTGSLLYQASIIKSIVIYKIKKESKTDSFYYILIL